MRRRGKGRGNVCPQEPRGGARHQSLLQPAPASRVGYPIPVPTNFQFSSSRRSTSTASPLSLLLYARTAVYTLGTSEQAGHQVCSRSSESPFSVLPTSTTHYNSSAHPPSLSPLSLARIRTCVDAAVALADGDAQSLAHFFRGLLPPAAKNGGPQHVCLKHAFALMDRRWSAHETLPTAATADGGESPLVFGRKKYLLSPELFANVVSFLNPNHALRTTSTCKAWWRNGEI